jgi:hypothetical protein
MLANMPKVMFTYTVQNILALLSTMDEIFYLTGSRFFNTHHVNSDWDFFVLKSFGMEYKLKEFGFKEISTEAMVDLGYDVSQFSTILEFKAQDGVIQIQIIENISAKNVVQNMIKEEYIKEFNSLDKAGRKKLWSLLLKAYGNPQRY